MVNLLSVRYGYQEDLDPSNCNITNRNCTAPDTAKHNCIGFHLCDINLPTGNVGRNIPACKQYANYATATYACIKRTSINDICTTDHLTSQTGYISTPNYPYNYTKNSLNCKIQVEVEPTQWIYLYSIDINLGSRNPCTETLYINTIHSGSTICRERRLKLLEWRAVGYLTLTFNSTHGESNKGLWLYYRGTSYNLHNTTIP